jgi:hypothetical protein
MTIKVKDQKKESVYTAQVTCTMTDRKNALAAIDEVIAKNQAKELTLPTQHVESLKGIRAMLVELRPKDQAA